MRGAEREPVAPVDTAGGVVMLARLKALMQPHKSLESL